jgi:hypothetical protein
MQGLSDRFKMLFDNYIIDVLKLLFLHLDSLTTENPTNFTTQDVASHLYDQLFDQTKYPLTEENLAEYSNQLRKELNNAFP